MDGTGITTDIGKGNAVIHAATRLPPDLFEINAENASPKFELQLFVTNISDFLEVSRDVPIDLGEALFWIDEEIMQHLFYIDG